MTEFKILTQDEKDDLIVEFMHATERDLYWHEMNLARFKTILKDNPSLQEKPNYEKLKSDTERRIAEVSAIKAATEAQLPPPERVTTAKQRLAAKAAAQVVK